MLLRTLVDGIARGELRADLNTTMARDMLFGGIEHLVWNELGRNRRIDAAANAEQIVGMMMSGWASHERAEPGSRADEIADLRERLERIESILTQRR